ncbi:MAG: efflux RND transporter permease subunit, partial [Planctomycetota bacterium]
LPEGVGLELIFDQNRYVENRLSTLLFNLLIGGAAVFVVILLLMGWRNAIVVSSALPLASLMVLSAMRFQGIPVHQMSITGLIIALGLLIDNAIVVVDEVSSKMRAGHSPAQAVTQSVKHLFLPLLGSTLTTAFAFGPIALMPGPAGEFVGSIALNVIVAISSSFFLAMTIVPALAATINQSMTPNGKRTALSDGVYFPKLAAYYSNFIDFVLARPWVGIAAGMFFPVLGLMQASQLEEQFFPPADRDQLHIEVELQPQASVSGTLAIAKQMRQELLQQDNILRVDWFVGESAPTFYYNLIARKRNTSQYAQAIVQLDSADNVSGVIHQLQAKMDRQFPQARVLVRQLEQGPPFDAPVEVRIFGPDLYRLKEIGTEVRQLLVGTPGVLHTRSELDEVLPKIELSVTEEKARAAGLDMASIARQVDAWTEGRIGGSIVEATEELPVRVRLSDSERDNLESLGSVDLVGPVNRQLAQQQDRYSGIPLSSLADIQLKADFGSIPHLAGRRMNEIQCYIPAGVLPSEVLNRFKERLDKSGLEKRLPPGYAILFGGESAKRDEAIGNLMGNVGVLLVLMVATLVLSFGSFRLAGLIGTVGALSVGLGMGSLWLYGFPFGFMAIVGTMGLIGVAINDSIVVLAAIRGDAEAEKGDRAKIRDAVCASTRHIISTSLTTMAGFAPLIIGGGGFWPPLAIAIAGGVGGATILALIFVPSAYIILKCPRIAPVESLPNRQPVRTPIRQLDSAKPQVG